MSSVNQRRIVLIVAFILCPPLFMGVWFFRAVFARSDVRRFAFREFLVLPILIFVASILLFYFVMAAPGDPVHVAAGPSASEETIERLRHELGLDRPLHVQYVQFMGDLIIHQDLGESIKYKGRAVSDLFWERFQISAPLGLTALIISAIAAISLGLVATFKKGTIFDTPLISFFMTFQAIPVIILIQVFIMVFSLKLGLLPAGWSGGWDQIFTTTAIIPVLSMSIVGIAGFARFVRALTIDKIEEQYVMAARARGVHPVKIAIFYVLRNASLPLMTVLLPAFFTFFEGSLFVEIIYGIPGLARFTIDAVFSRDYPIILSLGLIFYSLSVFTWWLVDLSYHAADPRVSLE